MVNKKGVLKAASLICVCAALCGCEYFNMSSITSNNSTKPRNYWGIFTDDDYLECNGKLIKNAHGNGDKVVLRGVNSGGLCVLEGWMSPFERNTSNGIHFFFHRASVR